MKGDRQPEASEGSSKGETLLWGIVIGGVFLFAAVGAVVEWAASLDRVAVVLTAVATVTAIFAFLPATREQMVDWHPEKFYGAQRRRLTGLAVFPVIGAAVGAAGLWVGVPGAVRLALPCLILAVAWLPACWLMFSAADRRWHEDPNSTQELRNARNAVRDARRAYVSKLSKDSGVHRQGMWAVITERGAETTSGKAKNKAEKKRLEAFTVMPSKRVDTGSAKTHQLFGDVHGLRGLVAPTCDVPGDSEPIAGGGDPHMMLLGGTDTGKTVSAAAMVAAAIAAGKRVIYLNLKGTPDGSSTASLLKEIWAFDPDIASGTYCWPHPCQPQPKWEIARGIYEAKEFQVQTVLDMVVTLAGKGAATGNAEFYKNLVKSLAMELFRCRHLIGQGGWNGMTALLDVRYFKSRVKARLQELRDLEGTKEAFDNEDAELRGTLERLEVWLDPKQTDQKALKDSAMSLSVSFQALAQQCPNVSWQAGEGAMWWDNDAKLTVIECPPKGAAVAAFLMQDVLEYLVARTETEPVLLVVDEMSTLTKVNKELLGTTHGDALLEAITKLRSSKVALCCIGQDLSSFGEQTYLALLNSGSVFMTMKQKNVSVNDLALTNVISDVHRNTRQNDDGESSFGFERVAGTDIDLIKQLEKGEMFMAGGGEYLIVQTPYDPNGAPGLYDQIRAAQSTFGRDAAGRALASRMKLSSADGGWGRFVCGNCAAAVGDGAVRCRRCGSAEIVPAPKRVAAAISLQGPLGEEEAVVIEDDEGRVEPVTVPTAPVTEPTASRRRTVAAPKPRSLNGVAKRAKAKETERAYDELVASDERLAEWYGKPAWYGAEAEEPEAKPSSYDSLDDI